MGSSAFKIDIDTVLQLLINVMTPGTANNPFVINMSIGGGAYASQCTSQSPTIAPLVQTLFDIGVPIFAATGNDGALDSISWPSCLPRVIKVSAVNNDGVGNTLAPYANLPILSLFPGEYVWLAPGGGGGTFVRSSTPSSTSITNTEGNQGTSFAAPHIAGLYAALKAVVPGIAINDISNFIRDHASVDVPVNVCTPASPCAVPFKRPRWP